MNLFNMATGPRFNEHLRLILDELEQSLLRSKLKPNPDSSKAGILVLCLLVILGHYRLNNDRIWLQYRKDAKFVSVVQNSITGMHSAMEELTRIVLPPRSPSFCLKMVRGIAAGNFDEGMCYEAKIMESTLTKAPDDWNSLPSPPNVDVQTTFYRGLQMLLFDRPLDAIFLHTVPIQKELSPTDTIMSDRETRGPSTPPTSRSTTPPLERIKYICMLNGPWLTDDEGRPHCNFCGQPDAPDEHLSGEHKAFECFSKPPSERTFYSEGKFRAHMRDFHNARENKRLFITRHDGAMELERNSPDGDQEEDGATMESMDEHVE
ncbi:MAG: hypothetical protein Q9190_001171 [Brigantiaea leucoxantha]